MGKDLKGKELGVGLTQRKDGLYSAKITLKSGKRKEKYFEKLKPAKDWIIEEKYLNSIVDTKDMLIEDWYKHWIKTYKESHTADNTVKNYKNRYKINIKNEIGKMKLCDVKQMHCQGIINKMRNENSYAQGTIELTQVTMHSMFQCAVDNNLILKNPVDGVVFKSKDDEKKERRVLSRSEQTEFIEQSKTSLYYTAFKLILLTGMRIGEIGGLKWSDIDFDNKCLTVKRTLLQDSSKGGFYFGVPKTKASRRIIPLTDDAINTLNLQKEVQDRLRYTSKDWNSEWDGLVFTTINGNPIGNHSFQVSINRIINNININRKVRGNEEVFEHASPHTLRHTFATRCIENNMQPKVLQKILGHSNLSTTMDLYVHVTDESLFEECDKIIC